VRFSELTQVWTIDHSLLLNRVSETTYLSTYVILNLNPVHTMYDAVRRRTAPHERRTATL